MFHLGKRETLVLDDFLSAIAPHLTHAVCAIRIDSDNGASFDFIASSRTWTGTGDPSVRGRTDSSFLHWRRATRRNRRQCSTSPSVRTSERTLG